MNTTRKFLLLLTAALVIATAGQAASPAGKWRVNANGFTGEMSLSVDSAGNVTGSFLGSPVKGFWTDSAAKLVLYRAVGANFEQIQIYQGYMQPCFNLVPNGSQCMQGSYQAFGGTGATASKNAFGWYAIK